ncbi:hypothetical protein DFP73DRAFT_588828 [Morchella snyderi]|nr:hypothetical protein DFP73DRAFT_588828 [Morchella snyderi]
MDTNKIPATTSCDHCSGEDQTIEGLQAKIYHLRKENQFLLSISDGLLQLVRGRDGTEYQTLPEMHNCPYHDEPPPIRPADQAGMYGRVDREGQASADEIRAWQSRLRDGGPNTVVNDLHLGLVRAGDVARLGVRARQELDDGLRSIARTMFPRGTAGDFTAGRQAMMALLGNVSLRHDVFPQASESYFLLCRDSKRGRYQRASDARHGYLSKIEESVRANALYYETFLQLTLFQGIDLEQLP